LDTVDGNNDFGTKGLEDSDGVRNELKEEEEKPLK
jgi:hypothetical protein